MNLEDLLIKFEDFNKIPKRRLIKELKEMNLDIRNKIIDIQVANCKQILDITFDTKPHNIILHLPKYYPFNPITCQVKVIPINKNHEISQILGNKLPFDLIRFTTEKHNNNIWSFIDNSKIMDGKDFIYENLKENEIEQHIKLSNYDKIYSNWFPGKRLEESFNKYMECLEPFVEI